MKLITAATLAVSVVGAAPLSDLVEDLLELKTEQVAKFDVKTLGGMTLRAPQVYNGNFYTQGRGPRAYLQSLRKFSQFGATVDPSLLCIVDTILQELGLSSLAGAAAADCSTATGGSGTGSAASSKPTATGAGTRPSATGRPSTGNATGTGQGMCTAAATPEANDVEYLTPVQIGSPPQTVMLDFDTGSSDLWVFTSNTPTAQSTGHQLYNPNSSTSGKVLSGATWSITYGDGSGASGTVVMDTVNVGGVTVQNQAVEAATKVSGSFVSDTATSGLLGLAMNSINQVQPTAQKTFFSNAMESLAMPLFTANLKAGETGNYNFGFVDQSEFTGSVNFVPVNTTQGFWQFAATGFAVGSGAAQQLAHQAIADTGTTLMLMPDEAVEAYYKAIPSAQNNASVGGFVFDCTEQAPSFTAVINGYQAVVPGDIIKFAPVDGATIATSQSCFGGIQSNSGLGFAIYGDIFLKAQFTVFDGGNMRIGFAAKSAGN